MLLSGALLSLLYVVMRTTAATDSIVIRTDSGPIQGYREDTLLGKRPYYTFKGIPYAEAPLGDRRFKAPEQIKAWQDVLNASEYGNICVQISRKTKKTEGNENCLFLNVFSPNVSSAAELPVVFYIHGGAYYEGGTKWVNPDILLDEDIVLVTIQYRLGPFGFLALDHPEYSGNQGLKDQLLALEWVNRNIHNFGGTKSQITLWGHSAGASAVNFHVLSPQAKGLFQRAILAGGAVYNQFAYLSNREEQTIVLRNKLSELLEISRDDVDNEKIINWISNAKTENIEQLLSTQLYKQGLKNKSLDPLWVPVIEKPDSVRPFLLQTPDAYFDNPSDIDTLIGYTSGESIFFTAQEFADPNLLQPFNEHFEIQAPLAGLKANESAKDYEHYLENIRQFYFGRNEVGNTTLNEYTQLLSDVFFRYGIYTAAKKQANRSSGHTYFFEFDVITELNYFRDLANATALGVHGAAHIEDLIYLFKTPMVPEELYTNLTPGSNEVQIIEMLRSFFINFVRFGNPTPSGQPVNLEPFSENMQLYVSIRNDGLVPKKEPRGEAFSFWSQLLQIYRGVFQ